MSSTATPPRSTLPPLDDHHYKKLLKHIEAAGGITVVSLKELCDNHPVDLGEAGSDLRRQVQRKHDKLKNKWTAARYLEALKANNISASDASEKAAFLEKMAGTEDTNGNTEEESSADHVDHLSDGMENLHVDDETEPPMTPPRVVRTPTRVPGSAGRLPSSPPPSRSASRAAIHRSPPPAHRTPPAQGDGTQNNPFVLVYDFSYPERCCYPFIVKYQPKILHDNYEYQCFDIEKVVDALDMDVWEATIPAAAPAGYHQCVVDLKGPSVPYFRWHQKEEEIDSEHKALLQDLEDDPTRKHLYWRIVFPNECPLNNNIFSTGRRVTKKIEPLAVKKNDNEFDKDFFVLLFTWRIAIDGGARQLIAEVKTDKSNIFKGK